MTVLTVLGSLVWLSFCDSHGHTACSGLAPQCSVLGVVASDWTSGCAFWSFGFVAIHSCSRKTSMMRLPVDRLAHPINWALVLVVLLTV